MGGVSVRLADKKDVDAIAELASRIFGDARVSASREDVYFVAESEGRIIGFVHLVEKGGRIILQGLGVEEKFRGSGVGTRLLDAALAYCGRKGAGEVALKVKALNPAARLYLKHGFFAKKTGDVYTLVRKRAN